MYSKMPKKKLRLMIDGSPLVADHFSGVGHSLLGITRALEDLQLQDDSLEVVLFAPTMLKGRLHQWGLQWLDMRGIPMPRRVIGGLQRRNALPPLDLILGHGVYFFPNFLNWRMAFSKSILLIHDISFEIYPEFVDGPNQRFLSKNVPHSISRADVVATVSPSAKAEIEDFYNLPAGSVEVLPNAVDQSLFYRRDETEIRYVKAKYGVVGDYYIFVSNLEPRKNIIRMIKAYTRLPKTITDKKGLFLIGGGGWNDQDIKDAIIDARLSGFKILRPDKFVKDEDLPAFYSGAEALVYPPIYEGFGMPPLEAMACGTPVISSQVTSLPWVTGDAALKIDPSDIGSMTGAMQKVLDKKFASDLVRKGYLQVEKFKWENSARQLVGLARQLQEKKR